MDDTRRRFTIADGMILIAASAASMVDLRPLLSDTALIFPWLWFALPRLICAGLAFTTALTAIRLRRPRPGREDLWCRPGWVACVSVAIGLAFGVVDATLSIAALIRQGPTVTALVMAVDVFQAVLFGAPAQVVVALAAAWTVLALSGRWRSESGWIDRAGRAIGVYWIVLAVLDLSSRFFA
jgi:hypothetical protein